MLSYFYANFDLLNHDNEENPIHILLKSCYHMQLNVVIIGNGIEI